LAKSSRPGDLLMSSMSNQAIACSVEKISASPGLYTNLTR
jgi:hypothetical protein